MPQDMSSHKTWKCESKDWCLKFLQIFSNWSWHLSCLCKAENPHAARRIEWGWQRYVHPDMYIWIRVFNLTAEVDGNWNFGPFWDLVLKTSVQHCSQYSLYQHILQSGPEVHYLKWLLRGWLQGFPNTGRRVILEPWDKYTVRERAFPFKTIDVTSFINCSYNVTTLEFRNSGKNPTYDHHPHKTALNVYIIFPTPWSFAFIFLYHCCQKLSSFYISVLLIITLSSCVLVPGVVVL